MFKRWTDGNEITLSNHIQHYTRMSFFGKTLMQNCYICYHQCFNTHYDKGFKKVR